MPSILSAATALPVQSGGAVLGAATGMPVQAGTSLLSAGGPYSPGAPPGGGVATSPGVPGAAFRLAAARRYIAAQACTLVDARDNTPLELGQVSISTDADSAFWALRAEGLGAEVYAQLLQGEQPATVRLTSGPQQWLFVVDSVALRRGASGSTTSVAGRSVAALAAAPYELSRNWTNDGESSAAQMAESVMLYTPVRVDWQVESWLIPDRAFSVTGTPMEALRALADAVGAIVHAHPTEPLLRVLPRYPALPNEWRTGGVDVDIAEDAVLDDAFELADSPQYDAVYLAGRQGGEVGYVRIAGTAGASVAPFLTDPLLTDAVAIRQRGQAILGAATGGLVRVPRTLPVLHSGSAPGVLALNQMVRSQDQAGVWYGLVRSVGATFGAGVSTQQVVLERHVRLWEGSVAVDPLLNPLRFLGPIANQSLTVGTPFTLATAAQWTGGTTPYTWSMRSGTLPAGLTLNAATGAISGTPSAEVTGAIALRCVDAEGGMADSNAFQLAVGAAVANEYLVKLTFEPNSAGVWTTVVNEGTLASSGFTIQDLTSVSAQGYEIQSSGAKHGTKRLRTRCANDDSSWQVTVLNPLIFGPSTGKGYSVGFWLNPAGSLSSGNNQILSWLSFSRAIICQLLSSNVIEVRSAGSFPDVVSITSAPLPLNAWSHVEFAFGGSSLSLFINGVLVNTVTSPAPIGANCSNAWFLRTPEPGFGPQSAQHIDDFFVYRGSAPLHTSNFTPGPLP